MSLLLLIWIVYVSLILRLMIWEAGSQQERNTLISTLTRMGKYYMVRKHLVVKKDTMTLLDVTMCMERAQNSTG